MRSKSKHPGPSIRTPPRNRRKLEEEEAAEQGRKAREKRVRRRRKAGRAGRARTLSLSLPSFNLSDTHGTIWTCSLGAPPAPRNTNDFLIEDMEKREEDIAKRLRRDADESDCGGSREEEEIPGEAEFEDQYEESWQECVIDKYKEMNHDELARRMAVMEKSRDETEEKLRSERNKSDYLQNRLAQAEQQIRAQESSDSPPPPPPPEPSSSAYGLLPSGILFGGHNCSPNVISSPRA